jgi:hypothetical protein
MELSRQSGVIRLLIDRSFVTAKESPNPPDAVELLTNDFEQHDMRALEADLELEEMLLTRFPVGICAAFHKFDDPCWTPRVARKSTKYDKHCFAEETEAAPPGHDSGSSSSFANRLPTGKSPRCSQPPIPRG